MDDKMALLAALQRDISDRLRLVCEGMSEESFQQLVREIASVKLKYGAEAEVSASLRYQLDQIALESSQDSGNSSLN